MTKKIIFTLSVFILMLNATIFAQQTNNTVAYVNTTEIIQAMPEKAVATEALKKLSENYKEELKVLQDEYNKKYSDFITYQSTLAENIKLRRMQELTELEKKMNQFMELAQNDIELQEKKMLDPINKKVGDAIKEVGLEQQYTVIYDKSNPAILFISPYAIDATPFVKAKLQIN
jgi:outer membrane protein